MLYVLPPPTTAASPSTPKTWGGAGGTASLYADGVDVVVESPPGESSSLWKAPKSAREEMTGTRRIPPRGLRRRFRCSRSEEIVTVHGNSASKDAPRRRSHDESGTGCETAGDEVDNRSSKSLSECYFAGKGTALVLPAEAQKSSGGSGVLVAANDGSSRQLETPQQSGSNIQKHLQSMFYLLRPEETLKMAVKLESVHTVRTRYLVVVSRMGRRGSEESCLLGIDCNEKTTVGLVLRVLADTAITLDGDGGFSVSVCGRHHIFKPVSVQAMWSALQTLHRASSKARDENYFQGGLSHDWVDYYERRIESDRSCLNEWHAMDDLESRRPPSPDSIRTKPCQREETERIIRSTLKEIMMSVDLDEVTSKYIRTRLEEEFDMDLGEFKSFIDQEMLIILGQMDAPTEIFDHVYLGSEWNASNYEELKRNGVRHILNVTREIDNFFPGTFDYLNIRVYDDENTDLLKYWDNTFKYITKAKKEGSKVLVHCKMGVSRSASVVIAYAMKAYNWDFKTAMRHVKEKRNCIKPNTSFVAQLETYQGILDAMKNKEKLQRSKSETNLKSPGDDKSSSPTSSIERLLPGSQPTPLLQAFSLSTAALQATTSSNSNSNELTGRELGKLGTRPKSWSPENVDTAPMDLPVTPFRSLESLSDRARTESSYATLSPAEGGCCALERVRNVLLPCDNGESYSVSPNQIRHLPGLLLALPTHSLPQPKNITTTVKQIVDEFESQQTANSAALRKRSLFCSENVNDADVSSTGETWDPGEATTVGTSNNPNRNDDKSNEACDFVSVSDDQNGGVQQHAMWTCSSTVSESVASIAPPSSFNVVIVGGQVPHDAVPSDPQTGKKSTATLRKDGDLFSSQVDRVFDREEKRQHRVSTVSSLPAETVTLDVNGGDEAFRDCPSRQSSWGSYDSAVVLAYQGDSRDVPSRHSSWGSGDTRTLPSRNSSWGSYDTHSARPVHYKNESGERVLHGSEETVNHLAPRRKRCESSEDEVTVKVPIKMSDCFVERQISSSSSNNCDCEDEDGKLTEEESAGIDIAAIRRSNFKLSGNSQLSVSAPENSTMEMVPHECTLSRSASNVSSTSRCAVPIKRNKTFAGGRSLVCDGQKDHASVGIVQNLKKEFEALEHRESGDHRISPTHCVELTSPTINAATASEDLSFKKLIVKFENGTRENRDGGSVNPRPPKYYGAKSLRHNNNRNNRFSCVDITETGASTENSGKTPLISSFNGHHTKSESGGIMGQCRRPPVVPIVKGPASNVVATVIAKAALKQQQQQHQQQQQYGKTHPLARLHIKPRHNNPIYNTM